ncbi:MAG: hypothetical protein NVSMB63_12590 [Sediminibacterium sp.]
MSLAKRLFLWVAFLGCCFTGVTQDTTTTSSHFKLAVNYLTNAVYNGRKDSLVLPYITPSIGYYDKSGFYISGSVSYLSATNQSRVDLFSLDAGYDFAIGNKVNGSVYGGKYFYNQSSTSVRSEMKGSLGANVVYDPGIIAVTGGLDLYFSEKADTYASLGLSHSFEIDTDNDASWTIAPSVVTAYGTQGYYHNYLQKRPARRQRNGGGTTVKVESQNNFVLLDYELSLPLSYDAKKWGISFTPYYTIPKSPSTVTITGLTGNTRTVTEKLENTFYAEFGVYVKF